MKKEALKYVEKQITQAQYNLINYTRDDLGSNYPTRNIFLRIKEYINNFLDGVGSERWVIMPGLRGVGKTTILAQTYMMLLNSKKDPRHLLYFALDEAVSALGLSLKDILEAYEYYLGINYGQQEEKLFIFIDEIQSDESWGVILKTMLFDKTKNVFVFTTGSSAVSLQSNADVARRSIFEKLYPLNFCEFQMIKNLRYPINKQESGSLKNRIKNAIYNSTSASETYDKLVTCRDDYLQYWSTINDEDIDEYISTGNLPFAIKKNKDKVLENIKLQLDRIISMDISKLKQFDNKTLQSIKRLLFILADATDTVSIYKLANLLETNRVTLMSILSVLEKAELLIKVMPYGSNTSKVKKPSKYLFMSSAYRMSLLQIVGNSSTKLSREGKILEDIVGSYIYREFIAQGKGSLNYDASLKSADFILQLDSRNIVFEIGRGDKDRGQVLKSLSKVNNAYGIIICRNIIDIELKDNIIKIPLKLFLLS